MNLYIKAIGFEQVDSDFEEQMIHAGILDSLEKGLVIKNNELNRGAVIVRISESTGLYTEDLKIKNSYMNIIFHLLLEEQDVIMMRLQ